MTLYRLFITAFCFFTVFTAHAQNQPIGSWRSFMSYNSAIGVATDGNVLYTATEKAFYTFSNLNSQLDAYSKVEGMHDIGMECVAYDMATSTTVIVYQNGNIDLLKDNTFYNIPELKIKTIAGEKEVYAVFILDGNAYLSTSIGVVVLDLDNRSIKETYEFNVDNQVIPVKGVWEKNDSLYAITRTGMYRANKYSRELPNFQIWQRVDTAIGYKYITGYNNQIFVANDTMVYQVTDTGAMLVYRSPDEIMHLDPGKDRLFISEYDTVSFSSKVWLYNTASGIYDSVKLRGSKIMQTTETLDGSLFFADEFGGLMKQYANMEVGYITPTGPLNSNSFDIYANDRDLWIAHGGFSGSYKPAKNRAGIGNYKDDKWKYYTGGIYPPFTGLTDFSLFLKDEKTNILYAGSFMDGLVVINPDGSTQHYKYPNPFDFNIQQYQDKAQIAGMGLDSKGNLWVSTMFTPNNKLYVKTPENEWTKFAVPNAKYGGPLVIDDDDQIWFISYDEGGVTVYNANGTPADKSDDATYHLSTGAGFGNLPSNAVNCLAKDRNNNIWIGTVNGIGIVSNCVFPYTQTTAPCDAEIPVVQYDQYAGYLFAGNNVRTIAVDGANRKWVGTDDGVWLLSPDASKIVYRFTVDNSPLPSNRIQKIAIDHVTGDVYIGTEQGLVSYRSTATEGGTKNETIVSFPNPVPSGYTGTVAIKGLVANADVRITDVNGQLVYRTKALGGQAVWNGLDYTGKRPQSGVYLIFASDNNGNETYTGKLVLLH